MQGLQQCRSLVHRAGVMCRMIINSRELLRNNYCRQSTNNYTTLETHEPALFSIRLNTCSELYVDLYRRGVTKKKPLCGVDFDVVYADTMPSAASDVPVVLFLHGVAGSHRNFYPLLPYLTSQEWVNELSDSDVPVPRLIMPNFPGYGFTELDPTKSFSHNDEEKAHLILDFLKEINIKRVQVLVGHSAGSYTALAIHRISRICDSYMLVNPGGLEPGKLMRPAAVFRFLLSMIDMLPFLRQIVFKLKPRKLKEMEVFKNLSHDAFEVVARSMLFVDYEKVLQTLISLSLQRFPLVVATSKYDSVVGSTVIKQLMDLFNFDEQNLFHYNADGEISLSNLTKVGRQGNNYPRGFSFANSNHFLVKAHPEIIATEIIKLLTHVRQSQYQMAFKISHVPKFSSKNFSKLDQQSNIYKI